MTFAEYAKDFQALQALVYEAFYNEDGTAKEASDEVKASVASIVDQWQTDFGKKTERVAQFLIELENQAEAWKREAKKYTEGVKRNESTIAGVKFLVQRTMEQLKVTKIPAGVRSFVLQVNPPSLIVQNEEVIPVEYFDPIPASLELSTERLKKDLVDGKEIAWRKPLVQEDGVELYVGPGAIISRGTSLRIK